MALSGTFYTNVGSHWRLQLEWTATQNIANNTSTITAKLYWMALDSYGAVSSSATKDGAITIDGTSSTFSGAGLAALSGNQKKLLHTFQKTVTHNADGTKSVSLSAYFDAEVTLGGTYYSRISVSGTATLNTIPRASSLMSSASWTAGNNLPISISRASSSFTHTVKIYVDNALIKTVSGIGTSTTVSFSTTENTNIFTKLAQSSSKSSKIVLETYNGGSLVGSKEYTGTCTAPSASTLTAPSSFNIGDTISITINRSNSSFTHTIKLKNGSNVAKTYTNQTTSTSFVTSDIASTLYGWTPNSNSINLTLECTTYYNDVQVRTPTTKTITANVTNSNPTFGSGFTYRDTNATTLAVTGNNQYIIQNQSQVLVEIPTSAKATAVNGASMVSYVATLNGLSITQPYSSSSTVSFNFGTINASQNLTLSIKAIDSRGNSTTVTKTVTILPYSPPVINAKAERLNNFENQTTLSLNGSISLLTISGLNKNLIQAMQYRYKDASTGAWSSWSNFTYTTNGANYTATNVILNLDNTKSWNIEIKVQDKLQSRTISLTVPTGRPIFFIDAVKRALGFNDFPQENDELRINGRIVLGSTLWANQTYHGVGAIDLNNSDVTGANGIWFRDVADNNGEGLLFLKTGATEGSTDINDYHNFRIDGNGRLRINGLNELALDKLKIDTQVEFSQVVYTLYGNIDFKSGASAGAHWNIRDYSGAYLMQVYGGSSPQGIKLYPKGDAVQIFGNGRNSLKLIGDDHCYISYYPQGGSAGRKAYVGFGAINNPDFTIENEWSGGQIWIKPYNASFLFSDYGGHDGIQGAGKAILKWLGTSDTIQVRTYNDAGYGTLQAVISNASDRRLKRNIVELREYLDRSALEKVLSTKIYKYNMTGYDDNRIFIGVIADEAPSEIVVKANSPDEYDGVDTYNMLALLWRAVQELVEQVEYLEYKLKRR